MKEYKKKSGEPIVERVPVPVPKSLKERVRILKEKYHWPMPEILRDKILEAVEEIEAKESNLGQTA